MHRLAVLAASALLLTGCGGPSAEERQDAAEAREAKASAAAEQREADQAAAQQQAAYDACSEIATPLQTALQEVDSRLSVGLTYSDYQSRVGDIQVAFDRALNQLAGNADADCFGVVTSWAGAVDLYTEVGGIWGDCIDDYDCDFSEGPANDRAQRKWVRASGLLDTGGQKLTAMKPTAP